ncbi:MAG: ABC transporter permease, partial [Candidatus Zixiibacteriota bacterium]
SGDMTDLISALSGGQLFGATPMQSNKNYSRITVDLKQGYSHKPVVDSVRAMGFRAFSYAEEFEEITKFFTYFDLGLGVIGLIALFVASLGIINTMMMSITERRREIGILKALGADEKEIKLMFLIESALIGSLGSIFGIILGWGISRMASVVAKAFMEKQGVDPIEIFAIPIWLTAIAFVLGLIVSLIAGYYPSARAARVDPVEALRYE